MSKNSDEGSTDYLVERYVSGTISEREAEQLLPRLEADASVAKRIRENLLADLLLRRFTDSKKTTRETLLRPVSPKISRRLFVAFASSTLLLLSAIGVLSHHLLDLSRRTTIHAASACAFEKEPEKTSDALAVIVSMQDPVWEKGRPYHADSMLTPGPFRLQAGAVVLRFFSGASVFVEGPADLDLISSFHLICRRGRLQAEVPPQAVGFSIETPQTRIIDRGTSFVLDVSRNASKVHVKKGEIELHGAQGRPKSVKEGETFMISSAGTMEALPTAFEFGRPDFRRDGDDLCLASKYLRWKETRQIVDADPALLIRYDFEQESDLLGCLPNQAQARRGIRYDGVIVGGTPGPGRWPNKKGLELRRVSDRIRFDLPGDHSSLSLAVSIRIDALPQKYGSLVHSDDFLPGEVHWFVNRDGRLEFAVQGADHVVHDRFVSPRVLPPERFGRWCTIAAVLDGASRTFRYYFNGDEVAVFNVRKGLTVRLGSAEIGNWNSKGHFSHSPAYANVLRNLCGCIDEFLVLDRALTSEEVRLFHEKGPKEESDPRSH